jgi:hypothetical protein
VDEKVWDKADDASDGLKATLKALQEEDPARAIDEARWTISKLEALVSILEEV